MSFDKWFRGQRRLIQFLLLIIPFVNWVTEILVRVSAVLRKSSTKNILGLILYIIPWGIILAWLDLVWVILNNDLLLLE